MIPPNVIRVGKCLGPHGLQGGVKLFVLGDAEQLLGLPEVYLEGRGWYRVLRAERHLPAVVLFLAGIASRDAAATLRETAVYAKEADLPPLEQGSYYYHQLRGLEVQDAQGAVVARVKDVLDGGHQDLLLVENDHGESFLPLQAPYIEVLTANGAQTPTHIRLAEDTPEGLLPQAAHADEARTDEAPES